MIASLVLLSALTAPVDYTSKELGFGATFPSTPAVAHAEQKLGDVAIPVDTVGVDHGPNETYLITVTSYPPELMAKLNVADTLKRAEQATLTGVQGTLTKESSEPLQGHPAREYWARLEGGGLMYARIVMVKERMYLVFALMPAGKEALAKKFVGSFGLLGG